MSNDIATVVNMIIINTSNAASLNEEYLPCVSHSEQLEGGQRIASRRTPRANGTNLLTLGRDRDEERRFTLEEVTLMFMPV